MGKILTLVAGEGIGEGLVRFREVYLGLESLSKGAVEGLPWPSSD